MARQVTNRLHARAVKAAAKRWREEHPREWDELWAVLQGMVVARNPGLDSKMRWARTMAAMTSNLAEAYPALWRRYRAEALAALKEETGWTDPRHEEAWAEASRERMATQRRGYHGWPVAEGAT